MTPPLPGLQKIYSLFLLVPIQLSCVDIDTINLEELGNILQQILGYDFNAPLEIGNVLIWKISGNHEPFTPLQYSGNDIQFGSGDTYLLLTQKYLREVTAYYWLGTYSSLIDKQVTAKYAVLLTEFLKTTSHYNSDRIFIAREIEGVESDSFQHTVLMFMKYASPRNPSNIFIKYLDTTFPSSRPNLFVIRGYRPQIKKIPLSLGLQWLINNDMCLLLEVEYKIEDMLPIQCFCGAEINRDHVATTRKFIQQFYGYFENNLAEEVHIIESNRKSNDFKKFIEVLEDSRFYKYYEVDDSNDHLKSAAEFELSRNQEVLEFQVNSDGSKLVELATDELSDSEIDEQLGVLLDEKSVTGILFIFGNIEGTISRVKGIQLAEEYLDKTYPVSTRLKKRMRIIGQNTNWI